MKEFVNLRARSVSGQLSGDIPSTEDEQRINQESLIDASNINLSDLGSMQNTNNFGHGISIESNSENTSSTDETSSFMRGGGKGQMMNFDETTEMMTPRDMSNMSGGMTPPDGMTQEKNNNSSWIAIAISAFVLIQVILLFKFVFRRR